MLHPFVGDTVGVASAGDAVAVVAPTDDVDAVVASAGDVVTRRTRDADVELICKHKESRGIELHRSVK